MNEIVYLPNEGETVMAFIKRVVAEQSDREPLRIVVQLVEIALGELGIEAELYLEAPSWR